MNQPVVSTQGWVDATQGVVRREAFVSDDVYRQELARIFERNWVFLAHETEIPQPGDFVVRTLGKAPVIVVRDADGTVKAHLNSCRHRGAKVCRGDSGNARHFVCPYHGWTYERDGRLMTTTFDAPFAERTWIFQPLGPRSAFPKVAIYKGLVFGSWNATSSAWRLSRRHSAGTSTASWPHAGRHGGAGAAASLARQGQLEGRRAELRRRQPAHPHHPYRTDHARSGPRGARRLHQAAERSFQVVTDRATAAR